MTKNVNLFFPLTLVIFVFLELFLVKLHQNQLGIVLYLVYSIMLAVIDKRYFFAFLVYNFPLLPIILTDYKIVSFIGPHEIIYGIGFYLLFKVNKKNKHKLNNAQKMSIGFAYFLLFFEVYPLVKDIVYGFDPNPERGAMYIVKNGVRFFLFYQSLVYLIKNIYLKDLYPYIISGVRYAVITIAISMIYTRDLIIMGAGVSYNPARIGIILSGKWQRFVGFYGAGGDENSVGIFMVGCFAFFLALYEKDKQIKNHVVFMGFAVLGALLTGSRTTFMALATVILIFMITNKSGKSKFAILFACVAFYFAFSKQLGMVIQRFFDPDAQEAVDPKGSGRVFKWILYTNWIIDNTVTLVLGNQKLIPYRNPPHNYFIIIVYNSGVVPLAIFIGLFIKLIKYISFSLKKLTLKNAYYIIPFPFIIMTVNSFGSSIYLWIFIPMGAYFVMPDKKSKKNTLI